MDVSDSFQTLSLSIFNPSDDLSTSFWPGEGSPSYSSNLNSIPVNSEISTGYDAHAFCIIAWWYVSFSSFIFRLKRSLRIGSVTGFDQPFNYYFGIPYRAIYRLWHYDSRWPTQHSFTQFHYSSSFLPSSSCFPFHRSISYQDHQYTLVVILFITMLL